MILLHNEFSLKITAKDSDRKIRISADLPKRLRDDSILLSRVAKAAAKLPKYKSAKIRDYKLILNGKEYAPNELEQLPRQLRPSTLSTPRSQEAVAFFSRHSVFSNHYQSPFKLKGIMFNNMEQYLAFRRAKLAGREDLASQALDSDTPAEAKSILNRLKNTQTEVWSEQRANIAAEGPREKFRQNQFLLECLLSTRGLHIGEASKDTVWGTGLTLNDPKVLDHASWPQDGNLLGRLLMDIREEIRTTNGTPEKQPPKKQQQRSKPQQDKPGRETKK